MVKVISPKKRAIATELRVFVSGRESTETQSAPENINIIVVKALDLHKYVESDGKSGCSSSSDRDALHEAIVTIYRPPNGDTHGAESVLKKTPTIIHIGGSGFVAPGRHYDDLFCRHLAQESGCQIIDIGHRLAPEYGFPSAFNDVYGIYKFLVTRAIFFILILIK